MSYGVTDPWSDWYNAEVYNRYVHDYPIYRELNRWLAECAELATARRVLDLACGSGATARACLPRLPANAELHGVDASEPLVELARIEIRDPRARFFVAAAAALEDVVEPGFDRAVCNTAFWQFPSAGPVLRALGRLLVPDALFVWNVPAERLLGEPSQLHPFQAALARALEDRTDDALGGATRLDPGRLEEQLDDAGFVLERTVRHVYRGRQGELLELMKVPAMIAPLAPDLTPESRQAAVLRAGDRVDPEERIEVPWVYFVARRR